MRYTIIAAFISTSALFGDTLTANPQPLISGSVTGGYDYGHLLMGSFVLSAGDFLVAVPQTPIIYAPSCPLNAPTCDASFTLHGNFGPAYAEDNFTSPVPFYRRGYSTPDLTVDLNFSAPNQSIHWTPGYPLYFGGISGFTVTGTISWIDPEGNTVIVPISPSYAAGNGSYFGADWLSNINGVVVAETRLNLTFEPIPEPSTFVMLASSLALLAARRAFRNR